MKIVLIGDSTVTDDAGWGKSFAARFNSDVEVLNYAVSGRSSKSWYEEKRLSAVLDEKPDYALIQFGHNDQPNKGPERETDPDTTYHDYLSLYVNEFRKAGVAPVIISSVARRTFDEHGIIYSTLTPWAESARTVAQELGVPFIDLHTSSMKYHNKIGREESMTFNLKEGDTTHLNAKGAGVIADLIIRELPESVPELTAFLR